jgi:hypothetical protein
VYVNGADASRPDDILLAGALGGRAVIFHLAMGPRPPGAPQRHPANWRETLSKDPP